MFKIYIINLNKYLENNFQMTLEKQIILFKTNNNNVYINFNKYFILLTN